MKNLYAELVVLLGKFRHLALLLARLAVAYGFSEPALLKLQDIKATATWFYELGIPFATITAPLVSWIEAIGIVLLTLGLLTRFISLALMGVMLGAIYFVHLHNGFSVANNGFEIPLYYLLFLSIFATYGAGKYSLDRLFLKDFDA